jgi:kynurenine formamidase
MRIIDLTLELADGLQTHPVHPRCVVSEFASHAGTACRFRPPCQGFASRILMFSDHIGTHVDSPFHFIPVRGASRLSDAIWPVRMIRRTLRGLCT